MLIAFIATAALAIPPQTKVSTVTDDYAGTKVNDDYRWLEPLEKDSPEVKERLAALGSDASPTTPADLDKIVAREVQENAELAKKAGIKLQ